MARKTLGRYGLPGHAHTIKIRDLSGKLTYNFIVCTCSGKENTHTQEISKARCKLLFKEYLFFSGGQKARVVFADISLMQPDILILVSRIVKKTSIRFRFSLYFIL